MKTKIFIVTILTAIIASFLTIYTYNYFEKKEFVGVNPDYQPKMVFANLPVDSNNQIFDFTYAAERAVYAVVHVKTKSLRSYNYHPFYDFFGGGGNVQPQPVMGYGSGVIISSDGLIVTNNHVVESSDEIEVVLNDKRSFVGKVIGTDENTDLALIKIDATNLPTIDYGNSDKLKLGQWVLAVGNPYNLTSTVTAGIVSAKGRSNITNGRGVEAFIQTDAAINRGNSGGALVNTAGELVGINTAIASRTGEYSGNSFAIPVSIVKKVVADLTEFGTVQRALIGVEPRDIDQELAKEHNINRLEGVYVAGLSEGGAAREVGIKEGDIILSINSNTVNSVAELQDQVSRYRPNDKVNVLIRRNNNEKMYSVTLRNLSGNTGIVKQGEFIAQLGASLEPINSDDKNQLGIKYGVKITSLIAGKLMKEGVKEKFVITQINNQPIKSVDDIRSVLEDIEGGFYMEGIYPDGTRAYYAIKL